jgi:hypothetical protein
MKLTIFDRKNYIETLRKLEVRKAPKYVIDAYHEGHIATINEYYREKLRKRLRKANIEESKVNLHEVKEAVKSINKDFLTEALTQKDLDFIKAFFKMTNLDMVSGDRLPPDASKLITQKMPKNFGLKDLFKKLR